MRLSFSGDPQGSAAKLRIADFGLRNDDSSSARCRVCAFLQRARSAPGEIVTCELFLLLFFFSIHNYNQAQSLHHVRWIRILDSLDFELTPGLRSNVRRRTNHQVRPATRVRVRTYQSNIRRRHSPMREAVEVS